MILSFVFFSLSEVYTLRNEILVAELEAINYSVIVMFSSSEDGSAVVSNFLQ